MNIARGYQAQATTSQGNAFVIGASWSGGTGGKNGELYNPTANTWTLLPGCPVAPMLTADAQGMYMSARYPSLTCNILTKQNKRCIQSGQPWHAVWLEQRLYLPSRPFCCHELVWYDWHRISSIGWESNRGFGCNVRGRNNVRCG